MAEPGEMASHGKGGRLGGILGILGGVALAEVAWRSSEGS